MWEGRKPPAANEDKSKIIAYYSMVQITEKGVLSSVEPTEGDYSPILRTP
jgi:hypothetical protein